MINKENNFISAVVYVRDDQPLILKFITNLYEVLDDNFDKYEMIIVNDKCRDDSVKILKTFAKKNNISAVSIINLSDCQGPEVALKAGIDLAIGDFVLEFDSVLFDYKRNMIMDLYHHSLEGFDIVSARPNHGGIYQSKIFYWLFNRFSQSSYAISTERFRVVSRRAINRINSLSKTITYRKAAYANSGLSIDHLKYNPLLGRVPVKDDIKKTNKKVAINSLITLTDIAYRVSITLTIALLLLTTISGIYTVIVYLNGSKPVEGWTTMMLLLSGGFSGIFMVSAITIKYLSIIIDLILKKQDYLVESIEKI